MDRESDNSLKIFFIIGRGRSGTTLLSKILDSNKSVFVANESLFIISLWSKYKGVKVWTHELLNKFKNDLFNERWVQTWDLDNEILMERFKLLGEKISYATLCYEVLKLYAESKNKDFLVIGQKDTHFSLFLNCLDEIFNEAKYIYITRDCRDNIVSYKGVPFDTNDTISLAYRWKVHNESILRFKQKLSNRIMAVKYEDIIDNIENVSKNLCDFLEIEYDSNMLLYHKNHDKIIFDHLMSTTKPIDKTKKNNWEKKLTQSDLEQIKYVAGDLMNDLGYTINNHGKCNLRCKVYLFYGYLITTMEKLLFRLPFSLRAFILEMYRKKTESKVVKVD